ncbi:cytochrome p450 [Stemphylium lycopersici]|uniref:Cytochrome p450 n=1 Tax=Stemphylium lycopersici TaxID=183478 RepID=A0A364NDP4_STELY|nr:cytochrome p450 [Stemphylium lycopersici]RAR00968.1 cytochrome p450 [Stemphylium lycopersici]RAR15263.1 cytochrome p450 [Stemphylium lycopersici]
MDPFSITAGAIGITGSATTSIVQLHNLIGGLSEAQDLVTDIASSLTNINRPLAALKQLSISDESTSVAAKEDLRKAGVAEAVNKCGNACNEFSKNLTKWTKHSSTAKLSLRDRLSVGVWNREKIRTLNMQLQSCEATVQFAITSTQLMVQLRSEKTSDTDRENVKRQLQSLERKIQEHLDLTKLQQDQALERKRALEEEPEDEEDGGAQRTLAIKEVEQQSRLLEADQVSCGVVFSQVRSKRSGQEISNIITLGNSKALIGLPESVVGKINQRITDVRTEGGSVAIVGIYGANISLKDL